MFDNMQAEDVQQTSNSIKNCKFSTIVMDYLYLQILGALDQESPTFTEARSLRSSTWPVSEWWEQNSHLDIQRLETQPPTKDHTSATKQNMSKFRGQFRVTEKWDDF